MSYAVLSLPDDEDLHSNEYYFDDHPANLERKAEKYAARRGMKRGTDYDIFLPMTGEALDVSLSLVRNAKVVYVDAHGYKLPAGTINIPGPKSHPSSRQDVPPSHLGLRDSDIELLVAGVCNQESSSWAEAVPPGCVVIGYNGELKGKHYRHLYERVVDLRQLMKDARPPRPHELHEWQDHIIKWFEACLAKKTGKPSRSAWFITTGQE